MLNQAYATKDAQIVSMSNESECYAPWKREGFSGKVVVPMDEMEALVAQELIRRQQDEILEISMGLRSALAQLGIDTVLNGVTQKRHLLHMDTLFLSMDGERSEKVLQTIRSLAREGLRPVVGRAVLLPEESRLTKAEVEEAEAFGHCNWDAQSVIRDDGRVAIPPLPLQYRFDADAYESGTLRKVFDGASGRAMLLKNRETYPLPRILEKGGFFVGGFTLNLPGMFHAMLHRTTVDAQGNELLPMHSAAGFLEAVRTDEVFGDRQIEITNVNGADIPLEKVHVLASIHRAARGGRGGV